MATLECHVQQWCKIIRPFISKWLRAINIFVQDRANFMLVRLPSCSQFEFDTTPNAPIEHIESIPIENCNGKTSYWLLFARRWYHRELACERMLQFLSKGSFRGMA